jgi:NTE family protein
VRARRKRRRLVPLICAAALAYLILPHLVSATTTPPSAASPRHRIGLALSGGGARGIAHVGVLQVLEEHRIPIDFVAGSSMGAVVGGLYASGLSPAQLDSVISAIDWMEAFADQIPRRDRSFHRKRDDDLYLVKHKPGLRDGRLRFPPGILDGQRIDLLLKRLSLPMTTVRDFDSLAVPYRAVAADIVTGEAVVLDHGDLALAMRSSMSIPAVFAPREVDGRLLVDGGVTNNFPIDQVRRMGADVVIAVDIATPPQKREDLESVLQIALQVAMMSSDRNKAQQVASLGPDDVLIRPELGPITVASFDRAGDAIPIGRQATRAALPALERLAVSEEEYRAYQARRAARVAAAGVPTLDAVRLVNRSRLSDEVVAARLDTPAGAPLDVARLEACLDQLYGLELFESVAYDVAPGSRGNELTVTARERAWGPNYLQGGVAVFDDFEGPNFNVALAYSRTAINRRNGEWRTGVQVGQEPGAWTELYQPVDRGLRWFVDVELTAIERALNVFDGRGHKLSELGIRQYGGALSAGREMGTWGEARAGVIREGGRIRVQVGDPGTPTTHFDKGEAFAQLFVDRLDEVAFPHHGATLRVRGWAGLDALGSTMEYQQALVEGSLAATRGRVTALLGGMFATTRHSDAPLESRFRLGGLGQLSGLEQDELVGQHAALLRAMSYWPIVTLGPLAVNAGISAEYGNVFQSRSEIALDHGIAAGSAFLGADTPLGPLCIAYGRAELGRDNYYLTLGQPFGLRRPGFRSQ